MSLKNKKDKIATGILRICIRSVSVVILCNRSPRILDSIIRGKLIIGRDKVIPKRRTALSKSEGCAKKVAAVNKIRRTKQKVEIYSSEVRRSEAI